MANPLTSVIRLLAAPRVSVTEPGMIRVELPFLKLVGKQQGSLDIAEADRMVGAARWVLVVRHLLPSVTRLSYDTASARVEIEYVLSHSDPDPGGPSTDDEMQRCVEKLMFIATESAATFILMSRERREQARQSLTLGLEQVPVNLMDNDAVDRLTEMLRSV